MLIYAPIDTKQFCVFPHSLLSFKIMTDAFGSITWWGFSPSLDLLDVAKRNVPCSPSSDALNVLLVGAGDCRHILKTVAQLHRHGNCKINFYVAENNMELYARYILFMAIALEPSHRMGLQDKVELFLELYGNSLVRHQSMEYVQKMSTAFVKMVTDFDYLEEKLPIIDLSNLKFKERDALEGIFKFWRHKDVNAYDAAKCWELRLRQHLGVRYDSIPNVFDWDYSMNLSQKGAAIISSRCYSKWRGTGVAYEIREGNYTVSNRTLASGMVFKHEGERHARRGYWGDILVSPYVTMGIESENTELFKTANKVFTKTSEDIAEYNMTAMFHELVNKETYQPPESKESKPGKQAATLTEITEELEEVELEDDSNQPEPEPEGNPLDKEYEALKMNNIQIHFLPLGSVSELHHKSKYKNLFHLCYCSNSMVHHLNPDLSSTFADKATVILETAKFMLELGDEKCIEFGKKIQNLAESAGCKVMQSYSGEDVAFAKFSFNRAVS